MSQRSSRETEERPGFEEQYVTALYRAGINLGIFVMVTAAFFSFILAFARLVGMLFFLSGSELPFAIRLFEAFGITEKPVILMLIDIVDAALIGAILIVLTFGLKSAFTGKRYRVTRLA